MACCHDVKSITSRYARDHSLHRCATLRELERSVTGCDYGATSWTTRQEASRIAELLDLGPRVLLLEVGAGTGWPGLLLAHLTGCEVVLTDVPLACLRIAVDRAAADGLGERCRAVVADGVRLPFEDRSFDAVSHSDVLCCLPEKLLLLQTCRRVARAGAKMMFSVIVPTAGLSEAEHRTAIES